MKIAIGAHRAVESSPSYNEKKAGLAKARLEYWPRWADTITFQEG
jgi:hypothetical protein